MEPKKKVFASHSFDAWNSNNGSLFIKLMLILKRKLFKNYQLRIYFLVILLITSIFPAVTFALEWGYPIGPANVTAGFAQRQYGYPSNTLKACVVCNAGIGRSDYWPTGNNPPQDTAWYTISRFSGQCSKESLWGEYLCPVEVLELQLTAKSVYGNAVEVGLYGVNLDLGPSINPCNIWDTPLNIIDSKVIDSLNFQTFSFKALKNHFIPD